MIFENCSDDLLDELAAAFTVFIVPIVVVVVVTFGECGKLVGIGEERMVAWYTVGFLDGTVLRFMVLVSGRSQSLVIRSEEGLVRRQQVRLVLLPR